MTEERINKLVKTLEELLNTHVEYRVICKLNLTDSDAFICGEGSVRATIYFNSNWSDEFIVHHVQSVYACTDKDIISLEEKAIEKLNDRDYVLKHVERSVIGTKLNKELLTKLINREYLDLSVIYKVVLHENETERSVVTITKDLAERLDLTIEDLERASVINKGIDCYITASVLKILVESGVIPEDEQTLLKDEFYPMYVISSENGIDGAASILHTSLFAGLAETLHDDLYIFPSSIHELICVPCQGQPPYFFREMVAAINHDIVEADAILGNNVYIYNKRTKVIKIAE